ncbi:hypothetical protein cypCar_00010261 [Cyprinus carpio]|nr:hypothetical protein cypCar_00010261 [Cyprinus carpio]
MLVVMCMINPGLQASLGTLSVMQDLRSESERLNEVKGHLEIALLEKHFLHMEFFCNGITDDLKSNLKEELRKLREETNVETLKQELERERSRRLDLEQKMSDVLKTRMECQTSDKFLTESFRLIQLALSIYISDCLHYLYECSMAWLGYSFVFILSHSEVVTELPHSQEPSKEDLTVSEKFQLVLDVAQKAQNLFGKMADVLEKIKNLFMWVQPEITQKLYIALWVAFISSCVLPYKLMGFMIGLYAGIKFFIIDFLFKSCPKLRDKYDTPHIMWNSLPTDPQLKERSNATVSRRCQAL